MRKIFSSFLKNSHGQSVIIEYASIAILIILGILVIGPYVVRGVNAYFKSAEEQAHDSFREEIRQADLKGRETTYRLDEGCNCEELAPVCGDGSRCPVTSWMYPQQCVPMTCRAYVEERCAAEPVPDIAWEDCPEDINTGDWPIGDVGYLDWINNKGCGYKCCTVEELADPRCYFFNFDPDNGYLKKKKLCGPEGNIVQYFYEQSNYCDNRCVGRIDVRASWCDPETFNYNVDPGTETLHVAYGGCQDLADMCTGDNCPESILKCVAQCPLTYCAGLSGCTCPEGWKEKSFSGRCPAGFTEMPWDRCPGDYIEYNLNDQNSAPCR